MRRVLLIGVSLALALMGAQVLVAADHFVAPKTGQQDELQLPIYTPPKKLTPRARVGGTLRGTDGHDPELVALVPDHVGLTVKQTPTLNWYLSKSTTYPLRFTLNDTQRVAPLYEGSLPTPTQPGVQSINLKALGLALEPNVQYRWFVSARRNAEAYSEDTVVGGMIERCEFSECVTANSVNVTCDRESVLENSRAGFWYDAMACVCTLIQHSPSDSSLRRLRAHLLRQVGLNGVADWDLGSIQSSPK